MDVIQVVDEDDDVVIVSYQLALRLIDMLEQIPFGVVIADECHYHKNRQARRTSKVMENDNI